jgi:hypothetical protein
MHAIAMTMVQNHRFPVLSEIPEMKTMPKMATCKLVYTLSRIVSDIGYPDSRQRPRWDIDSSW